MRRIALVFSTFVLAAVAVPAARALEPIAAIERPPASVCPVLNGPGGNGPETPVCATAWLGDGAYPDARVCVEDPTSLVVWDMEDEQLGCVYTDGEDPAWSVPGICFTTPGASEASGCALHRHPRSGQFCVAWWGGVSLHCFTE